MISKAASILLRLLCAPACAAFPTNSYAQNENAKLLQQWGINDQNELPIVPKPGPKEENKCFTISTGNTDASTILLDQCSGRSWIMTRINIGKSQTEWVEEWNPIPFLTSPYSVEYSAPPPLMPKAHK